MNLKKLLPLILLHTMQILQADLIEWSGSSYYPTLVPNDGNTYYIGSTVTNASTTSVEGILKIITGGTYKITGTMNITKTGLLNLLTNGIIENGPNLGTTGTININGGTLWIAGGTFKNGVNGNGNVYLNNGTINFESGTFQHNSSSSNFNTYHGTFAFNYFNTQVDPSPLLFNTQFEINNGTLELYDTLTIPADSAIIIGPNAKLQNKSATTLNVNGDVYVHGILENGISGNAGTINVNSGGSITIAGGTYDANNNSSVINVNQGGTINNYFGKIYVDGVGDFNLYSGSYLSNVNTNEPIDTTNYNIDPGATIISSNKVTLSKNLTIDYLWTIAGKTIIDGQGYEIDFGQNGGIFIRGADSSLLIKNTVLNNISENRIRCSDNTTTLSIQDVIWNQDANYTFTKGRFNLKGTWLITGDKTLFAYLTDQMSTIEANATLHLQDVYLQYATTPETLLNFADKSSILYLERARLQGASNFAPTNGNIISSGDIVLEGYNTPDLSNMTILSSGGITHISSAFS